MSWLLVRGPAEHAFRRLRDAISTEAERRRMRRIRRNPAVLAKTVQSARNILVLCHGNIIRSPFAERRIAMAFDGRRTVSIGSAGLEAFPGRPSHPTAIETARALSVDLSQHEARQVDAGMIAESDLILAMEAAHLVALRKRFPEARAKAYLLTCLCRAVPLEVSDPVDGDSAVFQTCYEHIARATDAIVRSVLGPQH
jgi:protein-tyrosine phosphatase